MYNVLNILSHTHHHNLNFIGIFNDAANNTWQNHFVIFDNKSTEIPKYISENDIGFFNLNSTFLPWIRANHNKFDLIILHGSFNPTIWSLLAERIDICQKTSWIVFGGDLIVEQYNEDHDALNTLESNRIKSVKYLKAIWLISEAEKKLIFEKYHTYENVYYCLISIQEPQRKKAKHSLSYDFLLGNSSDKANRHEELIDVIHLYHPSAKILCPLSYPNAKRQKDVIEYGHGLLGENFIPLTDILQTDDYFSIIQNCKYFILPQFRQQAGQHWIFALKHGIPIYAELSSPFAKLILAKGGEVMPLESLQDLNQKVSSSEQNKVVFNKHFSRKNIVSQWKSSILEVISN
jgi:hypothetical protein